MTNNTDSSKGGDSKVTPNCNQAQLSQVNTYSKFLNELARQRHTLVQNFTGTSTRWSGYDEFKEANDGMLDKLDALIRDTLNHIAGNDLIATDPEVKS